LSFGLQRGAMFLYWSTTAIFVCETISLFVALTSTPKLK